MLTSRLSIANMTTELSTRESNMPAAAENTPYQIIWLVRRLFRALAQKSNELLAESGISASDRAVLEFLYPDKKLSVPEIAERYQVSRQHIQVTINALLESGLVATEPNPRHKRSPLIALSAEGRNLFEAVLKSDNDVIVELFSNTPAEHIEITRKTLQGLFNQLS